MVASRRSVARPLWDQRGRDHDAFVALVRQLTVNAVAARPCFIANPPSLRSRRSNAVAVFAIRPCSHTSPGRPPYATATTMLSL